MSLKVSILGSGSRGNAALVVTARSKVLIDAGFSYRSLCRRLAEVGESPESLDAVLVSHEHSDHISGLPVLSRKVKAPIYMTGRTSAAIDWGEKKPHVETFEAGAKLAFGDLEIETFTIPHDAVDPVGLPSARTASRSGWRRIWATSPSRSSATCKAATCSCSNRITISKCSRSAPTLGSSSSE
ncbi:MAG: MBL fold metallo-hydrolase [Bryobacterales bacterium]